MLQKSENYFLLIILYKASEYPPKFKEHKNLRIKTKIKNSQKSPSYTIVHLYLMVTFFKDVSSTARTGYRSNKLLHFHQFNFHQNSIQV